MTATPPLIDRTALSAHRARADARALFLQDAALGEVQDRLSMVNRTFKEVAIVTPFPAVWAGAFGNARLIPDTDTLDLMPNAFDLVIHAMCLHWANDPIGQLIQCRRALRPDGLSLSVLLGGQTLAELRAVLAQAEADITGGLSPRVLPMAELREWGALLQRAGLALPVADGLTLTAEYRDIYHLMRDLRANGETSAMSGRPRHPTRAALFRKADLLYRKHHATDAGRIRASFDLIALTGWAPDESQPRPLRPGSAQQRLAEALRTAETKLPD
jgi:SAM-dependent methyltransferase